MDIPPQFVYAPVALVYGDLPRPVVLTGLRIWGLGWRRGYESAGPVGEDELLALCGIGRSTLYGHLARLATLGVLRYSSTGGEYTFLFNKVEPMPHSPKIRTAQSRKLDGSPESWTEQSRKLDYSPENRTGGSPENGTAIVVVGSPPSVSASIEGEEVQQQQEQPSDFLDRLARLDALGIVGTVRSELALLPWATAGYLEEWVDWAMMDAGSRGLGGAYYVTQIRAGERAPRARMGRFSGEENG